MPRHTIFERIKPHARRAANAAGELGRKGFEAGKSALGRGAAAGAEKIDDVNRARGPAAGRANERAASGERRDFTGRKSNSPGASREPAGGRVVNDTTKLSNKVGKGLKFAGRFASRAFAPVAVGATALEAGIAGGKAIVGSDFGKRQLRDANIGGLGDLDPFGNPTIDALDAPDMVRPPTDSGGFFSTDARSLNPNRFVEDLDQGPASLNTSPLSRDQLLTGQQFDPNKPNVPLGGPATEGRTFDTEASAGAPAQAESPGQDPNNKRLSLKDALAGFSRTDNALGDAMALNSRLGLAGAFNKGLGDRNKFGLDERKFGLDERKQDETERQNDFSNAIDLNTANLENLAAQGDISEAEAVTRVRENTVFKNLLDNAGTPEAKRDVAFTQARKTGFDLESAAGQTMLSIAMRELQGEEDSGFGKFLNAITPGVSDPFGSVFDSADGPAPLLGADTLKDFTIKDGAIYADKEGKGVQSYMLQISDLPDTTGQFLKSVIGRQTKKKTLR